jgi:hypothetical protein
LVAHSPIVGVVVVGRELYGVASAHEPINTALWFVGGLNVLILAVWNSSGV